MVDSKTMVIQVQELQVILHEIYVEGMVLSKAFQVADIIEKLPHAWKDFKNYLKHKKKEMSIESLINRLHIKEEYRGSKKKEAHKPKEAMSNFVEHGQSSKFKKATTKLKYQGKCFNCGKQGHKSAYCRLPKRSKPNEANVVDDITKDV